MTAHICSVQVFSTKTTDAKSLEKVGVRSFQLFSALEGVIDAGW